MGANTYHGERAAIPPPPTGCPVHRTWSPLNDDYLADPYPIASALRSAHPVFYAPGVGCVVVTDMLAYWRYCRDFTADRRRSRGDDFASELIDAHEANPDDLSYREVESVIYGLSFAGHEAVTALLCNTRICLLPRRDVWAAIGADHGLIPNAIEEVLRFNSSQIAWRRITTRDTMIGGIDVAAGTSIFLNFASANRQENIFCDPDRFDPGRSNASWHISFGKGVHFCLGARLAKFEVRTVTEILSQRLPTLCLVEGQHLDYFPNLTFRGPTELHVAWT